jgi:hypothetical protein
MLAEPVDHGAHANDRTVEVDTAGRAVIGGTVGEDTTVGTGAADRLVAEVAATVPVASG